MREEERVGEGEGGGRGEGGRRRGGREGGGWKKEEGKRVAEGERVGRGREEKGGGWVGKRQFHCSDGCFISWQTPVGLSFCPDGGVALACSDSIGYRNKATQRYIHFTQTLKHY